VPPATASTFPSSPRTAACLLRASKLGRLCLLKDSPILSTSGHTSLLPVAQNYTQAAVPLQGDNPGQLVHPGSRSPSRGNQPAESVTTPKRGPRRQPGVVRCSSRQGVTPRFSPRWRASTPSTFGVYGCVARPTTAVSAGAGRPRCALTSLGTRWRGHPIGARLGARRPGPPLRPSNRERRRHLSVHCGTTADSTALVTTGHSPRRRRCCTVTPPRFPRRDSSYASLH
jgi:hypothetical protein